MPANSGAIRAGRAFIEVFADDSKLVRGLNAAAKRLKAFGASIRQVGTQMAGLGAAVVTPLLGAVKVFADVGSQLVDMSQRTGISVEALSELGFAANQSGSNLESFETGIRKMQRSIAEAADGSQSANASLAQLGLTVAALQNLSPDQQFKLIADRIAAIQNPAQRAAAAIELFGRSGTQLLPLMSGGAQGIERLQEQARALGITTSTADAQAAEQFGDTLDTLWAVVKRGVVAIGAVLAPVLSDVVDSIIRGTKVVTAWIGQHEDLIATVFQVAAAVAGAGLALVALGTAISGLGTIFGTLATIATTVGSALGTVGTVLGFLLTPIGLVIGGIVALGAYLVNATGVGAQALGWLGEKFAQLQQEALAAFHGIGDALAAGDIGLAARILWLTLKMEWRKGVNFLEKHWLEFKRFFVETIATAQFAVSRFLVNAWADLQTAWVEATTFMANAWTKFTSFLSSTWEDTKTGIATGLAHLQGLFDAEFDTEGTIEQLNQMNREAQGGIERDKRQTLAERERERNRRGMEIEEQRKGTLGQLDQMQAQDERARETAHRAAIQESADLLQEARAEWQAAIAEAARQREGQEKADDGAPRLDRLRQELGNLDDVLADVEQRTARVDTAGTFNPAALLGLGADSLGERTAKASEQVAQNTKRLLQEAQHGGLVFD